MSLSSPSRIKTGTPDHVKGAKVMKATDHSQWHRQKHLHGLAASSPVKTAHLNGVKKLAKGSGSKDELLPPLPRSNVPYEVELDCSVPLNSRRSNFTTTVSLEKLLANPIHFKMASEVTLKDEQRSKLIKARPRKILSDEHRVRRERTSLISKVWPPIQNKALTGSSAPSKSRPLGLDNPHNFCYRRSVLQAFLHLPILYNWLLEVQHGHARTGKHDDRTRCVACDFSNLARAIRSGARDNTRARLRQFDLAIRTLGPKQKQFTWLMNTSQADAHEFMLFFIDVFQDLLKLPAQVVRGIFKLQVLSQWTCQDCKATHTATPTDDSGLHVTLRKTGKGTLVDLVRDCFHDVISDARCDNPLCQSKSDRTRTRVINAAPEVLFVQLARFSQNYDPKSRRYRAGKDSRPVAFEQFLDLSEYAVRPEMRKNGTLMYMLSSVVAHAGSLHGGHYIAYAEGPSGVMEFDDDNVRECSRQKMLNPGASFTPYILTYTAVEKD